MNKRFCKQKGHQLYTPYLFCTSDQCDSSSRWVCLLCYSQKTHEHGNKNNDHLVQLDQLKIKLQDYDLKQSDAKKYLTRIVEQFKAVEKMFDELKDSIRKGLLNLLTYEEQLELEKEINDFQAEVLKDDKILNYLKYQQLETISNIPSIQSKFENFQVGLFQFELTLRDCQPKQQQQQYLQIPQIFNSGSSQNGIKSPNKVQWQQNTSEKQNQGQMMQQTQQPQSTRQQTLQQQQLKDLQTSSRIQQFFQKTNQSESQQIQSRQLVEKSKVEPIQTHSDNKIKYELKEIDKTNKCYNASQISKNELYLAYGGSESIIKVFNLKENKLIKEIKIIQSIMCCQFTDDSSRLFVGTQKFVYGFDCNSEFNLIYQDAIHQHWVSGIITIQNQYIITCSADKSIIKTDTINKLQIFKLTGHTSYVKTIDYNDFNNIIISGSTDKTIKLWSTTTQSIIIDKPYDSDIIQIQSLKSKLNILTLDKKGNLIIWFIDYAQKDLILINQFTDENKIFHFYQVNQGQSIVIICNKYAKILNYSNGKVQSSINHDCVEYISDRDCKQLDNLKYILIRAQRTIKLMTRIDK